LEVRLNTIETTPERGQDWTAGEWQTLCRDPRYAALWSATKSRERLIRAGFIEDPQTLKTSSQRLPVYNENGIVLLMTGCFAPMHAGHVGAMSTAKAAIEAHQTKRVVAGFFGFCHDRYVATKTDAYPLERRLRIFEDVQKEKWMHPYLWESEQNAQTNFTAVWAALQNEYPDQTVVLVYGSDNEAFKDVVRLDEWHVCVHRTSTMSEVCVDKEQPRLLHVPSLYPGLASTQLRKAER
jgi:nicotinic acid mononucleotide adenylyltransferase